jgi:hypothetical protein
MEKIWEYLSKVDPRKLDQDSLKAYVTDLREFQNDLVSKGEMQIKQLREHGNEVNMSMVHLTRMLLLDVCVRRDKITILWMDTLRTEDGNVDETKLHREAVAIKKFETAGEESSTRLNIAEKIWLEEMKAKDKIDKEERLDEEKRMRDEDDEREKRMKDEDEVRRRRNPSPPGPRWERSREDRWERSASRDHRSKYPPEKPRLSIQHQLVPRMLELSCSNEEMKDFSKAAMIYSEASNIDSQSNGIQLAYLTQLISSELKTQFKIFNEKNKINEADLKFANGIDILNQIYSARHNIILQRLEVMRMTFKGDKPEDLLNWYYEYSKAVDTSSIMSMDREEYLALNLLLQVGSVRQKKILEKTSKPELNDILDHINSEITVNNISQGLMKKGKTEKVLRVETEESMLCFRCNKTGHFRQNCGETDERRFYCNYCNIYGHERSKCRKYDGDENENRRRSLSSDGRRERSKDDVKRGSSRDDDRKRGSSRDNDRNGRSNDRVRKISGNTRSNSKYSKERKASRSKEREDVKKEKKKRVGGEDEKKIRKKSKDRSVSRNRKKEGAVRGRRDNTPGSGYERIHMIRGKHMEGKSTKDNDTNMREKSKNDLKTSKHGPQRFKGEKSKNNSHSSRQNYESESRDDTEEDKIDVLAVEQGSGSKRTGPGSRTVKVSESKTKEEVDMTILFDTGSTRSNLIDKDKLRQEGLKFEEKDMSDLPHLVAANGQRIELVGFTKLFVRLEEHKKRKLVLFFVTPGTYDVCLLGLSTLRNLHWVGAHWPADIPEINSDEDKRRGQKVYNVKKKGEDYSSTDSDEEVQKVQKTKHTRKKERKYDHSRSQQVSSQQEESDDIDEDTNTINSNSSERRRRESSMGSSEDKYDDNDDNEKWSPMTSADEIYWSDDIEIFYSSEEDKLSRDDTEDESSTDEENKEERFSSDVKSAKDENDEDDYDNNEDKDDDEDEDSYHSSGEEFQDSENASENEDDDEYESAEEFHEDDDENDGNNYESSYHLFEEGIQDGEDIEENSDETRSIYEVNSRTKSNDEDKKEGRYDMEQYDLLLEEADLYEDDRDVEDIKLGPLLIDASHLGDSKSIHDIPGLQELPVCVQQVLWKYESVFANRLQIGTKMNVTPVRFQFKPGAENIEVKTSRQPQMVSLHYKEEANRILDELLLSKYIKPAPREARFISPAMFIAKKHDLTTCRLVIDYSKYINDLLLRPMHPQYSAEDLSRKIHKGMKSFFSADVKNAYFTVPLAEGDLGQRVTTFLTHRGKFCFNSLPQGIFPAGDFLGEIMEEVLQPIKDNVLRVVDDVLAYCETEEQAVKLLEIFLSRCRKYKISLSPKKFRWAKDCIDFAGIRITQNGVTQDPDRLAAIRDFAVPESMIETRRFLGMCNTLASFTKTSLRSTSHLREILKKKNSFVWTSQCQQEFDHLRVDLSQSRLLHFYNPRLDLCLDCDTQATKGLGFTLYQMDMTAEIGPENFYLLRLGSAKAKNSWINFSPNQVEATGCLLSLKKMHYFVTGAPLVHVFNDNRDFCSGYQRQDISEISISMRKIYLELREYSLVMHWRSAEQMCVVDTLGRCPDVSTVLEDDPLDYSWRDQKQKFSNSDKNLLCFANCAMEDQ